MDVRFIEASKSLGNAIDALSSAIADSSQWPMDSTVIAFRDRLVDCWEILCGQSGVYGRFTDLEAAKALRELGIFHERAFGVCDGYLKELTLRCDREHASIYADYVDSGKERATGIPFRDEPLKKNFGIVTEWLNTKFYDLAALDRLKAGILKERAKAEDAIGFAIQDSGIVDKLVSDSNAAADAENEKFTKNPKLYDRILELACEVDESKVVKYTWPNIAKKINLEFPDEQIGESGARTAANRYAKLKGVTLPKRSRGGKSNTRKA
jgi:hypothetical protein